LKHFHLGKSAATGLVPPAGMTSVLFLQVVFAVRTDSTEDLEYLEELLQKHPDTYRKIPTSTLYKAHTQELTWRQSYSALLRDRVCIKIDDDIVYIRVRQHTTVPEVCQCSARAQACRDGLLAKAWPNAIVVTGSDVVLGVHCAL